MQELLEHRQALDGFVDELLAHLRSPSFPQASSALLGLNKAAERLKLAGGKLDAAIVASVDELSVEMETFRVAVAAAAKA